MTGVWALLGAVLAVALVGVLLKRRDGRVRTTAGARPELPGPVRDLLVPGTPVTLLQVSTSFCAACRRAGALLGDLADRTEGLRHVELDVTGLPEVAKALGVLRAPTTLALDASGAELLRVGGVPEPDALTAALRPHLPGPNG
ncbi:TlpA family protein disulfide reductase [Saccharothrix yanglingensis]|uniref:Thiol reductase thioredoxin n=1 Tax=Saccharothrix yanglingensis TaxID=659496 RepID=A0ABU0WSI0_9PSEU|nr:thioredoxin family protein [Saccharothrix yanglingensis]MDQ2582790.1 thiol reductase thioredoxin [Saccharothrix yanglingensis]